MHVYVESQDCEHKFFGRKGGTKYCRFASLRALAMNLITQKHTW